MLGIEAFDILKAYGIPVVKTIFAKTVEEAVNAAEEIGYPLVMKVVSPQISHKSDIGGIRLSLHNSAEVKAAYHDMMEDISKKMPVFCPGSLNNPCCRDPICPGYPGDNTCLFHNHIIPYGQLFFKGINFLITS